MDKKDDIKNKRYCNIDFFENNIYISNFATSFFTCSNCILGVFTYHLLQTPIEKYLNKISKAQSRE